MESKETRIKKLNCILFDLKEKFENYIYNNCHFKIFFLCVGAIEDRLDEIGG